MWCGWACGRGCNTFNVCSHCVALVWSGVRSAISRLLGAMAAGYTLLKAVDVLERGCSGRLVAWLNEAGS